MSEEYVKLLDELQRIRIDILRASDQDTVQRLLGEMLGVLHFVDGERYQKAKKEKE